jgi:hypothetical protein
MRVDFKNNINDTERTLLDHLGNPYYHGGKDNIDLVIYIGNRGISRPLFTYLRDKLHGQMNIGPINISYYGMESQIDARLIYNRGKLIGSNSTDAAVNGAYYFVCATGDGMRSISRASAYYSNKYDTIICNNNGECRYVRISFPKYKYDLESRPGNRTINIISIIGDYGYSIYMSSMRLSQYNVVEFNHMSITIYYKDDIIIDATNYDSQLKINKGAEYFINGELQYIGTSQVLLSRDLQIFRPCGTRLE